MVDLRSPNFKRWNNALFINAELNAAMAPIAIGAPVKPSNAVRAIELNGAVPTTVIIPPNTIPIINGLASVLLCIISPILINVLLTTGVNPVAINLAIGARRMIEPIKSIPSGTYFSVYFIM